MAHGMRHCISLLLPNIFGNAVGNEGAAWTAGNPIFPILSESLKPNIALA
jgi:hypothetical protein